MIEICSKYKQLKYKIPGLKILYPKLKSTLMEFSNKKENILKIIDDDYFEKIVMNFSIISMNGKVV